MKKEQYIQLVEKAHIDAEEKEFLTEILRLVDEVTDLPSDLILRLEEIFAFEAKRLDKEREKLLKDREEAKAALEKEEKELPHKLEEIDKQALEKLDELEKNVLQEAEEAVREEESKQEEEKKKLDDKRYREILEGLKKEK